MRIFTDRTLSAAAHAGSRRQALCVHARLRHFSAWNDVMAVILKLLRQIENPILSIDAYRPRPIYAKIIPAKISPRSDLKCQSLFEEVAPRRRRTIHQEQDE